MSRESLVIGVAALVRRRENRDQQQTTTTKQKTAPTKGETVVLATHTIIVVYSDVPFLALRTHMLSS